MILMCTFYSIEMVSVFINELVPLKQLNFIEVLFL